jgi:hypothetical protein
MCTVTKNTVSNPRDETICDHLSGYLPYTESWQFFLSDNDRLQMSVLTREEQEVSRRIQGGPSLITDSEVRSFYVRYRVSFENWKRKASEKMWDNYKDGIKNRGQAWKLLKRIRGNTRAVPIEPGKLLAHFCSIFFDNNRPLAVQYPTISHRPVHGPFLQADYQLHEIFSREEVDEAITNLNKEAGVGPGRVSAKWLTRIFVTEGSREYLLFFFQSVLFVGFLSARMGRV